MVGEEAPAAAWPTSDGAKPGGRDGAEEAVEEEEEEEVDDGPPPGGSEGVR